MARSAGRRSFPAATAATFLTVAALVALAGTPALGSSPAASGPPAATGPSAQSAHAPSSNAAAVPTLVGIRAFHRPGVDRVVFELRGGLPARRTATYVDRLISDGRGRSLRIAGRAILQVSMELADAHDATGSTAPGRLAFALPNVLTVVRSGDFEGVVSYGIGLAKRTPFTVSTRTGPSRVVVSIRAGFPTVPRKVWFLDRDAFVAGTEPFFTPVSRPVRVRHKSAGLLDRVFAGPTSTEIAAGLRLIRSKARGWADLSITNDVARVRLTRSCSSGGSTVTVAGEIMPTLRQLATVDFVKILAPDGSTETPTGRSDSIPACLEP